ncbi:MAG: hypothetical protein K8L99_18190 [Anaerolineae bacterium]|nr:hypothetical protein [Anaerolineae bacterium]
MAQNFEVRLDTTGIDRLLQSEPQKVERWLDGFAEDMVTGIKLSFGSGPGGQEYTRGSVTHIASQPGYPPNVDIGALMGSIRWEPTGALERTIMDGVEYGIWLEDGTEDILPRPWMAPIFDDARQRIERDARDNLGLDSR